MGRIILAGIAGGFAMFVMMSILHLSPVAQIGFSQMTNDTPALDALQKATGNKPGLYVFPTVDMKAKDAMAQMDARMKVEPFGIMAYQPPGSLPGGFQLKLLVREFANEIVQSILAATLLSFTLLATYWSRVGFVVAIGAVAAIATNVSYWNWYGFSTSYTLANIGIELASFLAAGLAIAALVKPQRT
jgi:hypothetical protein